MSLLDNENFGEIDDLYCDVELNKLIQTQSETSEQGDKGKKEAEAAPSEAKAEPETKAKDEAKKDAPKKPKFDTTQQFFSRMYSDLLVIDGDGKSANNTKFGFSNASWYHTQGVLNLDILYPQGKKQYQLMDFWKQFKSELLAYINDPKVASSDKYSEISRVSETFQYRGTVTPGFIRDEYQQVCNQWFWEIYEKNYTLVLSKQLDRKQYIFDTSIAAAFCIRANYNARQIYANLIAIVEDETEDEQTRMEFADNLELNARDQEIKVRAAEYINRVVGEVRAPKMPIKGKSDEYVKMQIRDGRLTEDEANKLKSQVKTNLNDAVRAMMLEREQLLRSEEEDDRDNFLPERANIPSQDATFLYLQPTEDDNKIYTSSQNVHLSKISNVIFAKLEVIEKDELSFFTFFIRTKQKFFKDIKELQLIEDVEGWKVIEQSLARIAADPTIFAPTKLTLSKLFQRVYNRVVQSRHKSELLKRLVEELTDTAEFCVSGYVSRLINVLSGFEDADIPVEKINEMLQTTELEGEMMRKLNVVMSQEIKKLDGNTQDVIVSGLSETSGASRAKAEQFISLHRAKWLAMFEHDYSQTLDTAQLQYLYDKTIIKMML
jgi:hypothetical protein